MNDDELLTEIRQIIVDTVDDETLHGIIIAQLIDLVEQRVEEALEEQLEDMR